MADDERRAEIEAVGEAMDVWLFAVHGKVSSLRASEVGAADVIAALDRVRDARGDDEVRPDTIPTGNCTTAQVIRMADEIERGYPAIRSPQGEDHEARALCERMLIGQGDDTYDPHCARRQGHGGVCSPWPCPDCDGSGLLTTGVLDDHGWHADACPTCGEYASRVFPSRDGTVAAVEDVARWLQHIDRLDEIAGAKAGLPKYNPLWDAAEAIRIVFGSPASTDDRKEKQ